MIFLCPKKTPIKSTANEMCVCVCVRKKERTIERASECFTVICNDIRLYSCNSCFTRICKYVYYTIIWNTIIYSLNGIVLFCTPRVRAVSLHPWKCPSETGQNAARSIHSISKCIIQRTMQLKRLIASCLIDTSCCQEQYVSVFTFVLRFPRLSISSPNTSCYFRFEEIYRQFATIYVLHTFHFQYQLDYIFQSILAFFKR